MKNELLRMKKAIFSGLSYMIPLVAGSGLLMAIGVVISMAMGYNPSGSEFAWSIDGNNLEQLLGSRIDQLIWWTGKNLYSQDGSRGCAGLASSGWDDFPQESCRISRGSGTAWRRQYRADAADSL